LTNPWAAGNDSSFAPSAFSKELLSGAESMTLTKDQIIHSVQEKLDLPQTKSAQLVEYVLEAIKEALEGGEDVLISGFGKFCVNTKKSRKGRNPATGEDLMLSARRVVTFRCSPVLRNHVNGGRPS
jgi:integration host factor subunit alpha